MAPPNGTSGVAPAARRGALVRHVFSVASILACDARDPLLVAQLRLALLIIERMLEGGASAPLLLSVDLGGHLPLWRFSSMHVQETTLPSPQPLLAGGYTLLADLLTQNLRKATFDTALYLQALALLHRLLVAQHRSSQSLPLFEWPALWSALFTTADFISSDTVFKSHRNVAEVGLRLLELMNLLIALGDKLFPSTPVFESFAYEIVRRHATFEKLYRVSKEAAPRVVSAMALARSMIVAALDALRQMKPEATGSLTAAQALGVVRGLEPNVTPEALAALLRPPSLLSAHDQNTLSHSMLRVLLEHCRRDGWLAPIPFESF